MESKQTPTPHVVFDVSFEYGGKVRIVTNAIFKVTAGDQVILVGLERYRGAEETNAVKAYRWDRVESMADIKASVSKEV